ncbi:hypothetical protein ACHAXS_007694 [Conticribra weissflogii]
MGVNRFPSISDCISSNTTMITSTCSRHEFIECDACPYCSDVCDNPNCLQCQKNQHKPKHLECRGPETNWLVEAFSIICPGTADSNDKSNSKNYTMCQLKRHNQAESAWILVGDTIYDATPFIHNHPGGKAAILKKAGGAADCSEDMKFHSKRAQKELKKYKIGTLVRCPRCM